MGVVLFHTGHVALLSANQKVAEVFAHGYVWVGFFYLLSGFVLTYSSPGRHLSRYEFYKARIARIYPAYALALMLMIPPFILHIRQGEYPGARLILSLVSVPAMMQAWIPAAAQAWNYPAWSVSAEFFFYLVFPYALAKIKRLAGRSSTFANSLILPLSLLWFFCLLPSILGLSFAPAGMSAELASPLRNLVFFNPLLRLPEFLAGIFLGLHFLKSQTTGLISLRSSITVTALAILALLLVFTTRYGTIPVPLLHNGLLLPLWAALIYGLAAIDSNLTSAFVPPVLVLLGEASYGIYILQTPVSNWFKFLIQKTTGLYIKGDYPSIPLLMAYCALLTVCSVASFKLFETPVRLYLRKIGGRHAVQASAQVPALQAD